MTKSNFITRTLFSVVGEDYQLLDKCDTSIRWKYIMSSFGITLIFAATFYSFYLAFFLVFHDEIIGAIVSTFVTLMLYNIYKLNLITIGADEESKGFGYYISLLLRIFFMMIMAMASSKLIETSLFSNHGTLMNQLRYVSEEVPACWLFTIIYVSIFSIPFLIKLKNDPGNMYSRANLGLDQKIIEDDYTDYKTFYSQLMQQSVGELVVVEERFEDAPYNTIRKKDERKIGNEADFIAYLYGD